MLESSFQSASFTGQQPVHNLRSATFGIVDIGASEVWQEVQRACYGIPLIRINTQASLETGECPALADAGFAICGIRCGEGAPVQELLRKVRRASSHISVYLVGRSEDRVLSRLRGYTHAGAGGVFDLDVSADRIRLMTTVQQRVRIPAPRLLLRETAALLEHRPVAFLVMDCLRESFRRRTVADIERSWRRYHKDLNIELRAEALCPVGRLLRAGRLAHAIENDEERSASRERLAGALGFGTAKGLGEAIRRAKRSGLIEGRSIRITIGTKHRATR